jgi:hypothetical protein
MLCLKSKLRKPLESSTQLARGFEVDDSNHAGEFEYSDALE